MEYTLIILLLPLLAFLILGFGGKRIGDRAAGIAGVSATAASTLLSYLTVFRYFFVDGAVDGVYCALKPLAVDWLRFTDRLQVEIGILLDPISVMMLAVITTVSLMVHIYSLAYMRGEKGFVRYYAFLSLFGFSMLGLVVATNIFQMYIFWELVGVSSYLLIGFYYTKPSAVAASKKAFILTRFADLGFLVGILILSWMSGTFDFGALTADNAALAINSGAGLSFMGLSALTWAMALIFIGGAGKSAMFPLHIWLPDAMEGPTPVSALIHAATMVVAGVYLLARLFPVYAFAAPDVLRMISYIGAFTALFAAIIATVQTDVKRVLAFSTISQIAYMMVALGLSGFGGRLGLGYMASIFHLFTHAFFKALLFLGAGSVIHAVHSNEMSAMGGLRKIMPITHLTFLIACLAIAGIPPLSGFFSKDEILATAFHSDKLIFVALWITAGLTAFYMFRLYYRIFWGKEHHVGDQGHAAHESPPAMTLPLIFLALLTCATGFIPFARFVSSDNVPFDMHIETAVALSGTLVALAGIFVAFKLYRRDSDKAAKLAAAMSIPYRAAVRKFYLDELWTFITKRIVFRHVSTPIARFDKHIVDGAMNGIAGAILRISSSIKALQSGKVQFYAWVFVVGLIAISVWALLSARS